MESVLQERREVVVNLNLWDVHHDRIGEAGWIHELEALHIEIRFAQADVHGADGDTQAGGRFDAGTDDRRNDVVAREDEDNDDNDNDSKEAFEEFFHRS